LIQHGYCDEQVEDTRIGYLSCNLEMLQWFIALQDCWKRREDQRGVFWSSPVPLDIKSVADLIGLVSDARKYSQLQAMFGEARLVLNG